MITLSREQVSLHGCGRSTRATGEKVLGLVAEGLLEPVIDRSLPRAEAAEAQRLLERRAVLGRVVLEIP